MEIKVFGCKVNKYYTNKWLNSSYLFGKTGVFVASCVVTDKAKRKWLKFVRDIIEKENFNKNEDKVFISGCGAFKSGKAQEDFFEVYPELKKYESFIVILGEDPDDNSLDIKKKEKIPIFSESKISNFKLKNIYTKKFVLIQGGCDSFCTFCLTVIKRGRHFFRSKEDILEEILEFEKNGGKEVVLTGVNLSAWGLKTTNDIKNSRFSELIEYLVLNTKIPRIRISSLGPEFIDDKCLEVFKNERIYPHFHYSVQSGSSSVLKSMKRHYDGEYIKRLLKKTKLIKRHDLVSVSIGADIIVGFPGETEKDFLETLNLIKEVPVTKLHAFPFSAHDMGESVPAGSYENQISEKVKKDRMERILELGDIVRKDFINSQRGKEFKVLIENVRGDKWKGWTQNYIECNQDNFLIKSGINKRNEIVTGILK
ncbi:hypothetical protein CSB08_00855 [Candidatus Gracilibacteria bacterium]|nr:MAG: hypothetical protein CSB08_00855 [Candidatus Gracilibacteria bacterium]PIE85721.1 MAG: hypothetical protein CSA08_00405 [Candidatus Gracilibacteria bacterium]